MGLCASSDNVQGTPEEIAAEKRNNKKLDREMRDDQAVDTRLVKLLLLGAGESGKSTLFKQMMTLYGEGFSAKDAKIYESIVYRNVIVSMQALLENCKTYGGGTALINVDYSNVIIGLQGNETVDEEMAMKIKVLWAEEAIQNTYKMRSSYQLYDSANYFFENIDTIGAADYKPTEQHMLRARARTTGIVEKTFTIEETRFKMFDVGGQRNERKKWIHCFQDVTSVLFVGVLSEYNQTLFEDGETNRMVETLKLYRDITTSVWFKNTAIILFLNKRDTFAEKIQIHKLTTTCPVLFGKHPESINDYDNGCNAIMEEFRKQNDASKDFYCHITCATDKGNVATVFDMCKEIIINRTLVAAGLV